MHLARLPSTNNHSPPFLLLQQKYGYQFIHSLWVRLSNRQDFPGFMFLDSAVMFHFERLCAFDNVCFQQHRHPRVMC